ncbi:MAG: cyclohexanecarboxylate-CoA ligase [Pedosphaera sp.]|nr:cyclohexanecarboxylate-CoA ligase [Pedosphaera sp.]
MSEAKFDDLRAERSGRAGGNDAAHDESAESSRQRTDPPAEPLSAQKQGDLWAAVGDSLKLQAQAPPLRAVPRDNALPLSWAQQQLWIIQQADPDSVAYNLSFAWQFSGPLNVPAWDHALGAIVQRHETFRTSFHYRDGQPVQTVSAAPLRTLKPIDLEPVPAVERWGDVLRQLARESRRPFDLARGPLLRTCLLRLNESEHVWLLVMHHLVCDAASLGVLFRELRIFYEEQSTGKRALLPDLAIQYADFAVWQRGWLQRETMEKQFSYWKEQLRGPLPILELPADRTRPAKRSLRGALHQFKLPAELLKAINRFKRDEGVTAFNVLLAAFKALIYRHTGEMDILIGSLTANRNRSEIQNLIGFFANTLVLRTQVTGAAGFRGLLERVRETVLGAYANQDVPFEKLVAELSPARKPSHTPLFQVMFSFQSLPRRELELPGLQTRMIEVDNGTSKFDLTLILNETRQGLVGCFEYNTDLFEAATIERWAGHFQNLLAAAVANPDQPLWALPLLTQCERDRMLIEWNDTTRDYERGVCIQHLFERQVERSPEAIAATFESTSLSYRELNQRANRVAAHLQRAGVGPEVLVGIMMERSVEMLISMLAVLKAGGAYVPLDPSFPQDRLAFMVQDAGISVLLTQRKGQAPLEFAHLHRVFVDELPADETSFWPNPRSEVTPANLAYVLYTSGSTGKPKGVEVLHRGVVNFLSSMRRTPGIAAHDKLLAITTISFDIAALELLLPLTVGARVVIATAATTLSPAALVAAIDHHGITIMQATPATWRMLLEAGWGGNPRLKVLCGGETLPLKLALKLRERCGSLWNLYGPTETTIWSTIYPVNEVAGVVPIGRPIANTEVYVLDSQLQPVSVGVEGDLYIGGDGLARGYVKQPGLTAEKFIKHPFSRSPGVRLYKTGDRARYLPDGNLVCLGRGDQQVKVRGFRIELGEIESALAQHAAVMNAVVVVDRELGNENRLLAYWIARPGSAATTTELRKHLEQQLPGYMVPSAFVEMPAFPVTLNGKLDQSRLPKPEAGRPQLTVKFVAADNAMERFLAGTWREVLRQDKVGIHDNFFDLGGHSLSAMQVISRLQMSLGVELSITALFDFPTIAQFAERIWASLPDEANRDMVAKAIDRIISLF